VGHGGPELKFDAFNGDIQFVTGERIVRKKQWNWFVFYPCWRQVWLVAGYGRPHHRAFSDPSRPHTLKVHLINGGITVKGYEGRTLVSNAGRQSGEHERRHVPRGAEGMKRIDNVAMGLRRRKTTC
jgi:hypothetical protein